MEEGSTFRQPLPRCSSGEWILRLRMLLPLFYTAYFCVQSMGCTGIILWYVLGRDESCKKHLQFMVVATGVFGSRIWSALASVTLLLLRMKNLSYVLKARPFLLAIGWG